MEQQLDDIIDEHSQLKIRELKEISDLLSKEIENVQQQQLLAKTIFMNQPIEESSKLSRTSNPKDIVDQELCNPTVVRPLVDHVNEIDEITNTIAELKKQYLQIQQENSHICNSTLKILHQLKK